MRFPEFLQPGGNIGFVAPSFGCATEPYISTFKKAQDKFAGLGYELTIGPNCYEAKGIGISNTPDKCGSELTDEYVNGKSDVIISCGGGEMMCETLNHIDFDKIAKAKPKWYMGYSDNTNFTFMSATLADTAAIYGPCVSSFGMEPWHPAIDDALSLLKGEKLKFSGYGKWELESLKDETNPYVPYNVTEDTKLHTYPEGDVHMKGRLLGGCIDCMVTFLGTEFDKVNDFNNRYKDDGVLWFMEACELNVMGIRRAMWQMKNAGWFDNASGFIIGRPMLYEQDMMGLDQYKAVVDIIGDIGAPILMNADIGHLPPMIPIVCGAMGEVRTCGNSYSLEMEMR